MNYIVKQMMPLLEHVVCFCIDLSSMKKPEPVHSWCSLALTDCLLTLDGLVALIPDELLIHELTKVCYKKFQSLIFIIVLCQLLIFSSVVVACLSSHRVGCAYT